MRLPVDDQLPPEITAMNLSRRRLVARLAAAGLSTSAIAALLSAGVFAQDATPVPTPEITPSPEEILRGIGKDTRLIGYGSTVFGTPLELIDGLTVPNELFFIAPMARSPLTSPPPPGGSRSPVLSIRPGADARRSAGVPQRTVTAFLECSGDSRSRFVPEAEGTQWGNTAIGNAEWMGTPLSGSPRSGWRQGRRDRRRLSRRRLSRRCSAGFRSTRRSIRTRCSSGR